MHPFAYARADRADQAVVAGADAAPCSWRAAPSY